MKYNLHCKQKDRIETLALEAETAISNLDIREENYYRQIVAKNLRNIELENNKNNAKTEKGMETHQRNKKQNNDKRAHHKKSR
jgi:hypothetical protein